MKPQLWSVFSLLSKARLLSGMGPMRCLMIAKWETDTLEILFATPTRAAHRCDQWYYQLPALEATQLIPPLLIGIHWCGGTASDFFQVGFQYLAEQYGSSSNTPHQRWMWDVHSNETLTHDADTARIFVTGLSSGAMMTNVLAGAYPDVIRGGSAWTGVPYACFAGEGEWNTECALGETIKTPQEWYDLASGGYPGYTGQRPKMQLWHGTNDTTLYVQNFYEEVKQWTIVFNVSQTFTEVTENWPLPNWTKSDYGPTCKRFLPPPSNLCVCGAALPRVVLLVELEFLH
ncbi:Alpha/Beta hydrolase protein [Mucidula mucida]|nr:Alpha/Beta hydrolase protein [Mucidula mucida]